MLSRFALRWVVLAVLGVFLVGCGTYDQPLTRAGLGYKTLSQRDLQALPRPKGKIVVAVYSFRDQSGQYKFQENVANFSTAVTQGATSMLVQALRDSGWFIPVEREGLNDLLTERKIIRAKAGDEEMPRLIHAPLMLDGGIIAYETDVHSGGAGAEWDGYGGSAQFRKDQVTLFLRAVDVMTGQVIQTVSANKAILSTEVRAGIFRFFEIDRLLEVEIGFATNEPPQMCVMEAIEKAVLALVIQGIVDGLWELDNPNDINHPLIQDYLDEKNGRADQERVESLLERSRKALEEGKAGRAEGLASEGLRHDPYHEDLYLLRSDALAEQGKFDQAMRDAERAIIINSRSALAYNNRGLIYEQRRDFELALQDYRKSCELGYDVGCANFERLGGRPEGVLKLQ